MSGGGSAGAGSYHGFAKANRSSGRNRLKTVEKVMSGKDTRYPNEVILDLEDTPLEIQFMILSKWKGKTFSSAPPLGVVRFRTEPLGFVLGEPNTNASYERIGETPIKVAQFITLPQDYSS